MYDQDKDSYKSMTQMSKSQFLEMCDIPTFSSHIKAFAQVSAQDPTCILFGEYVFYLNMFYYQPEPAKLELMESSCQFICDTLAG